MGQVLYRKYRSKSFDEVVGQEHITKSLKHAISSGKVAHAYLFTGPRGVGKTSVARILAYSVNDLPYSENPQLDIIEIDAASNRRIDEIRDLRDKVNIAPTSAKYKVYIIDEVHMLTKEAFNALLKTLEEPPAHVIFILATTEAHKLPETIISRTQRYSFKPVEPEKVVEHLSSIARKEKIKIDNDALKLIADHGEGSFRDSISLLDQLSHTDQTITLKAVQEALGIAPGSAISDLVESLEGGSASDLMTLLKGLYEQGYQAQVLAKQLGENLRRQLIERNSNLTDHQILNLLEKLLDVPTSLHPESLLEIVLLEIVFSNSNDSDGKLSTKPTNTEPVEEIKLTTSLMPSPVDKVITPKKDTKHETKKFDESLWPELLDTVKHKHNTLYSFLRMARPEFGKSTLVLSLGFKFHQQRLDDARNKQSIADTVYDLTGENVEITCLFVPGTTPYDVKPGNEIVIEDIDEVTDPSLETINNIFGSSEVLES